MIHPWLKPLQVMRGLTTWTDVGEFWGEQQARRPPQGPFRPQGGDADEGTTAPTTSKSLRKKQQKIPATARPPVTADERLAMCVRVAPHLSSVMGGFFVALFERLEEPAAFSVSPPGTSDEEVLLLEGNFLPPFYTLTFTQHSRT